MKYIIFCFDTEKDVTNFKDKIENELVLRTYENSYLRIKKNFNVVVYLDDIKDKDNFYKVCKSYL